MFRISYYSTVLSPHPPIHNNLLKNSINIESINLIKYIKLNFLVLNTRPKHIKYKNTVNDTVLEYISICLLYIICIYIYICIVFVHLYIHLYNTYIFIYIYKLLVNI